MSGGYHAIEALKEGEIVVNSFAGPQPHARAKAAGSLISVNISRVVQNPETGSMTLVHHDTIQLPMDS